MVGGRLAGRWVAACGLWWCGVVSGHCCTTKPFAFFSFPSPTTSWTLSSAKTDTERSAKLDAGIGRDASSRHHPPPAVHAHCLVAGLGRRSPGCSERLSSSGCCKASGTPVTECLAPEQAPAAPALTGAHEKKGNLPCRLSLPRVCRSRSHGPAVPHSSTVPKQLAHLPRLGGIPAIVSAFASCRGRRVCLASTRSSTADRKTMARPPPSCLHSITRFFVAQGPRRPLAQGTRMTPSRLFASAHRRFHKTDIDAHRPNFNRPPTTHHLHHHFTPCAIAPHTPRRVIVAGSWVGSGMGFPCFFFPFASPAADTATTEGRIQATRSGLFLAAWDAGAGLAIATHGRRVWGSKRGRQGASRGNPAIVPWSDCWHSEKAPSIKSHHHKKEKPGLGLALPSPVSRPPPSVSRSPVAVTGSWPSCHPSPSMMCKTAMALPNRSGRLITWRWRDGVQPVPLHNPRTRHHVAHRTDRDGGGWRF